VIASQATNGKTSSDNLSLLQDKSILLRFTPQEVLLLDPLERLALKLMVERGKAIIVGGG
jgi:hypothetical protein